MMIEFMVYVYGVQIFGVLLSLLIFGLTDDSDLQVSKKSLLLWLLPYVMVVYYIVNGFIAGLRKIN